MFDPVSLNSISGFYDVTGLRTCFDMTHLTRSTNVLKTTFRSEYLMYIPCNLFWTTQLSGPLYRSPFLCNMSKNLPTFNVQPDDKQTDWISWRSNETSLVSLSKTTVWPQFDLVCAVCVPRSLENHSKHHFSVYKSTKCREGFVETKVKRRLGTGKINPE